MSCTNGCLYLAGDIANDRRAAKSESPPILLRLGVFCLIGGFAVAEVEEPPLFLSLVAPGNDTNIAPLFWVVSPVEYS